ncbi:unnamed protein product [Orchesella dallaii]|uniref:Uracil-DNA glycosylase-like domain-containing protein n=1 Tax=Orchesella dallaii TaxID=48710 RepID=A0ABP1PV86_9HEXA
MVHPCFHHVALQPGVANNTACQDPLVKLKFSRIFATFFPQDGNFSSQVSSWLTAIEEKFEFYYYEHRISDIQIKKVEDLFLYFGVNPLHSQNNRVFRFWVYLLWVYSKLVIEGYQENDIFAFINGFRIEETKVVIMGSESKSYKPSSGYMFTGSKFAAMEKVLDFLNWEIKILANHQQYNGMMLTGREMDTAMENGSLNGWIQQGVLLLTSSLTYFEGGPVFESWQIFTDFLLKYLSDEVERIVFILLGNRVGRKKSLIDLNHGNNKMIELYHPARYTVQPQKEVIGHLDWMEALPFLNANMYLYRKFGKNGIIDWTSVDRIFAGQRERFQQYKQFFDGVFAKALPWENGKSVRVDGVTIV